MSKLDISIYIPVFNGEKTIKHCLDSVIKQTLRPKKILVVNDCSTDKTTEILENYKSSIEIINNSKNLGISLTRDIAVNFLRTKYIAAIDADVVIDSNWLHNIYFSLEKNRATWVCGKMYEKYINNPCNFWRSLRLRQNWGEKDIINPELIFGCNNILRTDNLNLNEIYKNSGDYFKTNGDDNELTKYLKKKNHTLYYDSSAACYHLLNDNYRSLALRYARYISYGDGLKKRNFIKTLKNIIRSIKKNFFLDNFRYCKFKIFIIKSKHNSTLLFNFNRFTKI